MRPDAPGAPTTVSALPPVSRGVWGGLHPLCVHMCGCEHPSCALLAREKRPRLRGGRADPGSQQVRNRAGGAFTDLSTGEDPREGASYTQFGD